MHKPERRGGGRKERGREEEEQVWDHPRGLCYVHARWALSSLQALKEVLLTQQVSSRGHWALTDDRLQTMADAYYICVSALGLLHFLIIITALTVEGNGVLLSSRAA